MVTALRDNGLGQVLDFVPNHMGVGGSDNPLWLNVLEWGPDSIYAGWFDIDWEPDRRYLANKLAGALSRRPIRDRTRTRAASA
jgi:(1->4)-alpha-D-glucan 1-alpha-D-glucosylmutase